ncbi:MAG: hypothetical protein O7G31_04890 [Calditrichaeota bacterium]|nr:hypothetical protein [Calditrichota bacterium]
MNTADLDESKPAINNEPPTAIEDAIILISQDDLEVPAHMGGHLEVE